MPHSFDTLDTHLPIKPIFLVYDSRSGSTVLARKMMASLDNVLVTPEIGFDTVLKKSKKPNERINWGELIDAMYAQDFRNLPFDSKKTRSLVDGKTIADGLLSILAEIRRQSDRETADWIVIKNGTHIKYVDAIRDLFGDNFRLLHIVRDPRAVVSSKLITERPYVSGQVMAWAGSFFAALQWRSYVRRVHACRKQGEAVVEVSYEHLVATPEESIEKIGQILGIPVSHMGVEIGKYKVPEQEQHIHTRVDAPITDKRVQAWKTKMSRRDKIIVEALTRWEMTRLGYEADCDYGKTEIVFALLSGAAESLCLIGLEVGRRVSRKLRGANGE